jgi:uncharacterized protein (TIGR04222 family)
VKPMAQIEQQIPGAETVAPFESESLYQAIQDLKLAQPDPVFPFETKLAYQCSWTKGYAARVVREYRRFIYLTQVSKAPIAPSYAVDQAWHLHLLQTHFYWDVMCKVVLGKPLHHTPTVSGPQGRELDTSRYHNVLREYREVFRQEPPSDIWPAAQERFTKGGGNGGKSRRPKLTLSSSVSNLVAWLIVFPTAAAVYYADVLFTSPSGQGQLSLTKLFLVAFLLVALFVVWVRGNQFANCLDLDSYEAAYLHGGESHMLNAGLIRLVDLGLVTFETNGKTGHEGSATCKLASPETAAPIVLDVVESAVFNELQTARGNMTLLTLSAKSSALIAQVKERLVDTELINAPGLVTIYDLSMATIVTVITVLVARMLGVPESVSGWTFIGLGLLTGALWIPGYLLFRLMGTEDKTRSGIASLKAVREKVETFQTTAWYARPANFSKAMLFAILGSEAVIKDKRFYGINYLVGAMTATAHSDDQAGCGDNLPSCASCG